MSTTVNVDFSSVLPRGAAPPRVALAEVIELRGSEQIEHLVKEGIVVNLWRGRAKRVSVPPGNFLIRLRSPSGQLVVHRVEVMDEGVETSLLLVPVGAPQPRQSSDSNAYAPSIVVESSLPPQLDLSQGHERTSTSREQWSARLIERTERRPTLSYLPDLAVREVVNPRQDYMGVVKLMTSPLPGALRQELGRRDLSTYLIGDIDAIQAVRLHGTEDELHAQWKYPLRNSSIIGEPLQEGKGARYFALSYRAPDAIDPLQVACMPGRWRTRDGDLAPVHINYRTRRVGGQTSRAMHLEVDDPDFGGLIEFLQQGDLNGSVQIMRTALDLLYEKEMNPYAAAVAGYVLVQAGPSMQCGNEYGPQWLLNLASRYTGLPDGAILFTTLMLQSPEGRSMNLHYEGGAESRFRTPLGAALEAMRRGPPLFRYGLKLMATNLAILQEEASNYSDDADEIAAAIRYVRELALRVDPNQPFSVFDVAN